MMFNKRTEWRWNDLKKYQVWMNLHYDPTLNECRATVFDADGVSGSGIADDPLGAMAIAHQNQMANRILFDNPHVRKLQL